MAHVPFLIVLDLEDQSEPMLRSVFEVVMAHFGRRLVRMTGPSDSAISISTHTEEEYAAVLQRAADGVVERGALRRRIAELEAQLRERSGVESPV